MRKLMIIGGIVCGLLSGCSSTNNLERIVNCTFSDEVGDRYTETFVAMDNHLQTETIVIERDYAPDIASGSLTKEDIAAEYERLDTVDYDGIEGLDYSYTINDAKVVETIIFDFTKVSFTFLADIGYLDSADYEYIALDLSINNLKDSGYTCDV